jgi:hypothetical protein
MEARRAHRGEPPFFTTNLPGRSVLVQQQPPHARVTLMKVVVSIFRKRASSQRHNLDVQLYLPSVLAQLLGCRRVKWQTICRMFGSAT